ncbi:hypothetical protein BC938DRAFT_480279 [Jimgerdemannia flammicorona]|uniref:Uncharacterized protein n=1 Tax=Jimgerdemannia flammicorona TaxID=994334 RepID=A0A433QJ21_9FUNG|nr:hypothetical protein BC938DRAFT_480279 [Jimgerdemannia flammicorona]
MGTICTRSGCNVPAFFDQTSKIQHPYCCKTCAKLHLETQSKCSRAGCGRPCFVEKSSGVRHNYCSRTCAHLSRPTTIACARKNCKKLRYTSPTNPAQYHDYCSSSCYRQEIDSLKETKLKVLLDENNLDYAAVKQAFMSGWNANIGYSYGYVNNPTFHKIIRLQYPSSITNAFRDHQAQITASYGNAVANQKRWHGTKQQCALGNRNNMCPKSIRCGVCGITREGLALGHDRMYPKVLGVSIVLETSKKISIS